MLGIRSVFTVNQTGQGESVKHKSFKGLIVRKALLKPTGKNYCELTARLLLTKSNEAPLQAARRDTFA